MTGHDYRFVEGGRVTRADWSGTFSPDGGGTLIFSVSPETDSAISPDARYPRSQRGGSDRNSMTP